MQKESPIAPVTPYVLPCGLTIQVNKLGKAFISNEELANYFNERGFPYYQSRIRQYRQREFLDHEVRKMLHREAITKVKAQPDLANIYDTIQFHFGVWTRAPLITPPTTKIQILLVGLKWNIADLLKEAEPIGKVTTRMTLAPHIECEENPELFIVCNELDDWILDDSGTCSKRSLFPDTNTFTQIYALHRDVYLEHIGTGLCPINDEMYAKYNRLKDALRQEIKIYLDNVIMHEEARLSTIRANGMKWHELLRKLSSYANIKRGILWNENKLLFSYKTMHPNTDNAYLRIEQRVQIGDSEDVMRYKNTSVEKKDTEWVECGVASNSDAFNYADARLLYQKDLSQVIVPYDYLCSFFSSHNSNYQTFLMHQKVLHTWLYALIQYSAVSMTVKFYAPGYFSAADEHGMITVDTAQRYPNVTKMDDNLLKRMLEAIPNKLHRNIFPNVVPSLADSCEHCHKMHLSLSAASFCCGNTFSQFYKEVMQPIFQFWEKEMIALPKVEQHLKNGIHQYLVDNGLFVTTPVDRYIDIVDTEGNMLYRTNVNPEATFHKDLFHSNNQALGAK